MVSGQRPYLITRQAIRIDEKRADGRWPDATTRWLLKREEREVEASSAHCKQGRPRSAIIASCTLAAPGRRICKNLEEFGKSRNILQPSQRMSKQQPNSDDVRSEN